MINDDQELKQKTRKVERLISEITEYKKKNSDAALKVGFPNNVLWSVSKFKSNYSFIGNNTTSKNIGFHLMALQALHWFLSSFALWGAPKNVVIKMMYVITGIITETVINDLFYCIHNASHINKVKS